MIGQVLGNYRIEAEIGGGAMGRVYKARHTALGRVVAVKALTRTFGTNEEFRRRLMDEQQILDELRHTNIVALHDVHVEGADLYLILEFLDGETLEDRLKKNGRMPVEAVAAMGQQLLNALAHTHKRGVVHRDIKPANIMLTTDAAKLLDFGIAKCTDAAGLTLPGIVMGSPAYLPPERWEGEPVTPVGDIYALGLCLYEALTGKPPHEVGSGRIHWYKIHKESDVPDVRKLRPETPDWLARAVHKATRAVASERYQDGTEMLRVFHHNVSLTAMISLADAKAGAVGLHPFLLAPDAPVDSNAPTRLILREGASPERRSGPPAGYRPGQRTIALIAKKQRPWKWLAAAVVAMGGLLSVTVVLVGILVWWFGRDPTAFTLDLTNLKAEPITVACAVGPDASVKEFAVKVAAGGNQRVNIPALPADCYEVGPGGERTLIWSLPGDLRLDEGAGMEEAMPEVAMEVPKEADPEGETKLPPRDTASKKTSSSKGKSSQGGSGGSGASGGAGSQPASGDQDAVAAVETAEAPLVARVVVGAPSEPVRPAGCDDLRDLEDRAVSGKLTEAEKACLSAALQSTTLGLPAKNKRSRVLIMDANARRDTVAWRRLLKHHLDHISRADADICYAYAIDLSKSNTLGGNRETIRYAGYALENRHTFDPAQNVRFTLRLHKVRAKAAANIWGYYDDIYAKTPNPETQKKAELERGVAKELSRTWFEYSVASGENAADALELCRMVSGTMSYCRQ